MRWSGKPKGTANSVSRNQGGIPSWREAEIVMCVSPHVCAKERRTEREMGDIRREH